MAMNYAQRTTTPSKVLPMRLGAAIWRQAHRTPVCPETPRLDGKLAVVTGGNAGIGLEISRGLAQRGANVIIAARTQATAEAACAEIEKETQVPLHHVAIDLSDLRSVAAATEQLQTLIGARTVDILVANAGIWPTEYQQSAQGHEIAFAVNTLGHHLLVRRMLDRGMLSEGRVVILTGDIYIRSSDCTSDWSYEGRSGGSMAYSRSKLGNLWFAAELARRYPRLHVTVVHPGVVASNLGGEAKGFGAFMKEVMLLDRVAGAQTPLYCATQPEVTRGGYYHNTMGLVQLPEGDPALDPEKAATLWTHMEALTAEFR